MTTTAPSTADPLTLSECLVLAGGRRRWLQRAEKLITEWPEYAPVLQSGLQLQRAEFSAVISADRAKVMQSINAMSEADVNTAEFSLTAAVREAIESTLRAAGSDNQSAQRLAQLNVLFTGVALLQSYVVANFTGPPLALSSLPSISAHWAETTRARFHQHCLSALRLDGEDIFESNQHPMLLAIARAILVDCTALLSATSSATWWSLRAVSVHHSVMETNTASIIANINISIPRVIEHAASLWSTGLPQSLVSRLESEAYSEASHLQLAYWQYLQSEASMNAAQRSCGLTVEITGALGKRTRFQKEEKSQLVVRAVVDEEKAKTENESESEEKFRSDDEHDAPLMPTRSAIESDVLLPGLQFHAELSQTRLTAVQRAVLLALAKHLQATTVGHITINEQLVAFMTAILTPAHERSWAVECEALLIRSSIEVSDHHRQDRALEQMERLALHAFSAHTALSTEQSLSDDEVARVRLSELYASGWPPSWRVKLTIAQAFENIGLLRSALDVYASMNYIDGVIEMTVALHRKAEAEKLIRDRLVSAPSPKLWCLLGMVLSDPAMFERAWIESSQSYPRAQRLLAKHAREEKRWADAIAHSHLALALNPVFPMEWMAVGVCCLELHDYDSAIVAFTKTVHYDPDYAEAWNNLAASQLHLGNFSQALQALEQAIRLHHDSWKQWENYLHCAMATSESSKAITAVERIITLKTKAMGSDKDVNRANAIVEERVLNTLTHRVCEPSTDGGRVDEWLVQRWEITLTSLTNQVSTDPSLWFNLARVHAARGDCGKEIEALEKAFRTSLLPIPASHPSVNSRYSAFQLDENNLHEHPQFLSFSSHKGMRQRCYELLTKLLACYIERDQGDDLLAAQLAADSFFDKLNKSVSEGARSEETDSLAMIQGLRDRAATKLAEKRALRATANTKSTTTSSYAAMWR